uniref:Uncharacterized protein n=1 Tax=Rhizophora mucronata TaxID=61149 RepID=A0A2P2KP23_RHIMU
MSYTQTNIFNTRLTSSPGRSPQESYRKLKLTVKRQPKHTAIQHRKRMKIDSQGETESAMATATTSNPIRNPKIKEHRASQ